MDEVVFLEFPTVPIGDQTDVTTTDPLSSVTWKAPKPAKRRKKEPLHPDNGLKDLFINLEKLIKEDTPKTSQEMMRRSLLDGVHAFLIDVSDTNTLRRLSAEVLAFVAERIDDMRKN